MNTLIYDPDGAKNAKTTKSIWQILEEHPELKSELLKAILASKPEKMFMESPEILSKGWFDSEFIAYNLASDQWENNIKQLFGEEE